MKEGVGTLPSYSNVLRVEIPSLSMRSGWMMGCCCVASGRGLCVAGRSKLLWTSPVRSPMARSRVWLSFNSWLQTVLILSLSRVIRRSSLRNLWTMSSTFSYWRSADPLGEPGGDRGTGDGWSVGDSVFLNIISDSASSLNTGSPCPFSRATSHCVFLLFFFEDDLTPRERANLSPSSSFIVPTPLASTPVSRILVTSRIVVGSVQRRSRNHSLCNHFIYPPESHINRPAYITLRTTTMSLGSPTLVTSTWPQNLI